MYFTTLTLSGVRLESQIVPVVTIWVGVFPMRVNFYMALGSTIYFTANTAVLFYARSFSCAAFRAPTPSSVTGPLPCFRFMRLAG